MEYCVGGRVWDEWRRLAEWLPVMTTSVETPKAVADVWGAHRRHEKTKEGREAKGGGQAAHLGEEWALVLLYSRRFGCYSSRARVKGT